MQLTACECDKPGFCSRHHFTKSAILWELCRRRQDYFELWESGRVPPSELRPASEWKACEHRSSEPIDEIGCESCGNRMVAIPVYGCDLFQRCAERNFGQTTAERYQATPCVRCESYRAIEDSEVVADDQRVVHGPGILQRAANFTQAVAAHLADGLSHVSEGEFEERLGVCRACEWCDTVQMVCRHAACGCFLNVKASWSSEQCPLGKWSEVNK
jgi:hypothetical protein